MPVKSPIRKIAVCPRSWKCFSLRRITVCPRCRSGAVGSIPSFTRSGLPDARDFSSFARSSDSFTISAAPFLIYASCSSVGGKLGMRFDYIERFVLEAVEHCSAGQPGPAVSTLVRPQPPSHDLKLSFQHDINSLGIGNVLLLKNAGGEGMLVVGIEHGDSLLQNNC